MFCDPYGHAIAVEVSEAVNLEFDFDLGAVSGRSVKGGCGAVQTCQFVAVSGSREKSQPSWEGRSDVSRMYLGSRN